MLGAGRSRVDALRHVAAGEHEDGGDAKHSSLCSICCLKHASIERCIAFCHAIVVLDSSVTAADENPHLWVARRVGFCISELVF